MKTKLFLPLIVAISMGLFFACDTTDSDDTDDGNGGGAAETVNSISGTIEDWDGSTDKTVELVAVNYMTRERMSIASAAIAANGSFTLSSIPTPSADYLMKMDLTANLDSGCEGEFTLSDTTILFGMTELRTATDGELGGWITAASNHPDSIDQEGDFEISYQYSNKAGSATGYILCDKSFGTYTKYEREEINISVSQGWNKIVMKLTSKNVNNTDITTIGGAVPDSPPLKFYYEANTP
ncbi:MAG: hypothetical protein GF419_04020 [Ignavibacteriales bacterium]|nr:hypothetical protein [Ignavibacteriales bacterium]